jgi:fumarate reductase flavoprotein subunit
VSYRTWHLAGLPGKTTPDWNQSTILEPMQEYGANVGVDFRLSSPATGLIADGDKVKGVYCSDGSKEYAIEASKAVILATGGYSNNKEMFEFFSHVPFDRIHNWGMPGRDGDGIGWAVELGAATHIPSTVMFSCTGIPDCAEFYDKANWVFSWQPNLRVNQDAVRFVSEFNAPDFARISNAVLSQQTCYSIMDQAYIDMIADVALPIGLDSLGYITGKPLEGAREAVEKALSDGRVFKADTIEELADSLKLDAKALKGTLDAYNGYAQNGVDPEFGAPQMVLIPLLKPPYYGAEIQPACFTSVGGLSVNANLQVLREDGSVIAGLYALGGDASSDTGRDYDVAIMPGSQQGWCATGGRLAAEYIMGA